MKKSRKRIFFIIGALILVVVAIGIFNLFPLLSMKPAKTGKIDNTEIYAVNNSLNSLYFIELSDGYVLVDAGSDVKTIEESLKESNISPENVKYILLTHSDYDHVVSLSLFSNAKIHISEDELQMINGTTKRNGNKSNSLPEGIEQDDLIPLKEGQELIIGEHKIKCIKAPGHTPGSMAYLLDGYYLFTGDAFKVNNNTLSVHPFTMDTETSKKSIQKLSEIINESNLILTAHYGYYKTDDFTLD